MNLETVGIENPTKAMTVYFEGMAQVFTRPDQQDARERYSNPDYAKAEGTDSITEKLKHAAALEANVRLEKQAEVERIYSVECPICKKTIGEHSDDWRMCFVQLVEHSNTAH